MLPRLEAEEQLTRVSALAVGTGAAKKRDADKLIGELKRVARGVEKPKARTVDELRAIGIPVKFTPKRKEGDG